MFFINLYTEVIEYAAAQGCGAGAQAIFDGRSQKISDGGAGA